MQTWVFMIELSEQQIITQLAQEYAHFDGRPIRDFIPLFVERNATQELTKPGA
jgi:hypothetical protein